MNLQIRLGGIYFLNKLFLYTKEERVDGDKVGFGHDWSVGVHKERNRLSVKLKVELVNKNKTDEKYAKYDIGFLYEVSKYQTEEEEKELVIVCLHDSFAVLKGLLFSELYNTQLRETMIPTYSIEKIRALVGDIQPQKIQKKTKAKRQKLTVKAK
jgi:hypothetical protein